MILLSPKQEMRKKSMKISAEIQTKVQNLIRDKKLYEGILDYEKNRKNISEKLNSSEKILFQDTLKSFKKMGFDLKGEKEKEYKTNLKKLNNLELKFSSNIAE
jgi:Zn-dependent oligopeptidase